MFNLSNLFSKPATSAFNLGKPTAKHPGTLPRFGPFYIRRLSCEFVYQFYDLLRLCLVSLI